MLKRYIIYLINFLLIKMHQIHVTFMTVNAQIIELETNAAYML